MRAFTISMCVIMGIWLGVAYWGFRELSRVLQMTP